MNLSRSNNVVNLCATQSYAWIMEVIGREAANVYISAFGVQIWLQQTDPETCRRAAEICGRVTREKVTADHDFNLGGFLGALAGGKSLVVRHQVREEKEERFSAEDFSHLDVGDLIAYNKGRRGRHAKVVRDRVSYIFCTQKPAGAAAVNARVREYYREILENLTHERGQGARWDGRAAESAALPPEPPVVALPVVLPATVEIEEGASALTRGQIERERADFGAHTGSLDAVLEETCPPEPGGTDDHRRTRLDGQRRGPAAGRSLRAGRRSGRGPGPGGRDHPGGISGPGGPPGAGSPALAGWIRQNIPPA